MSERPPILLSLAIDPNLYVTVERRAMLCPLGSENEDKPDKIKTDEKFVMRCMFKKKLCLPHRTQ